MIQQFLLKRLGDGTYIQSSVLLTEEVEMKLECTLCRMRDGAAVKKEELYLVTIVGWFYKKFISGDVLVCSPCKNFLKKGQSHESKDHSHLN